MTDTQDNTQLPASKNPHPTFATESHRKPRVRAGAIAWGTIVTAIAATVLLVVTNPDSREAFADWLGSATPAGITIIAVLAVGVLILLFAGLALIRRAQRS